MVRVLSWGVQTFWCFYFSTRKMMSFCIFFLHFLFCHLRWFKLRDGGWDHEGTIPWAIFRIQFLFGGIQLNDSFTQDSWDFCEGGSVSDDINQIHKECHKTCGRNEVPFQETYPPGNLTNRYPKYRWVYVFFEITRLLDGCIRKQFVHPGWWWWNIN